jgi:thiamine-monophosphate kinase
MPGEFKLIARHFARLTPPRGDVALGVGDDAALLTPRPGHQLVATVDTLIEGVHFFADCPPAALGHKALAVNLSDLAAMGAEPVWALLALTLPRADEAWVAEFARGFGDLARAHGVALVGGDTCRGPLAVSVTALGQVPTGQALRRAGAQAGDGVYVSGEIGAAGLGVRARRGEIALPAPLAAHAAQRLDWPQPCVALGLALASPDELLGSGDDYELCFTVPAAHEAAVSAVAAQLQLTLTRIGQIEPEPGLRLVDADGAVRSVEMRGHDHFR